MAHCIVIAPNFTGHLDPMRAVAAALRARGHRTSFVVIADAAARLGPADEAILVGARTHPPGTLAAIEARIAAFSPVSTWPRPAELDALLRDLAGLTHTICDEAPAWLERRGADLILADQTEAAGGLIARRLGLKLVSIANALPIDPDPDLPPPFTAWRYRRGPAGRIRNRIGYAVAAAFSGPIRREIAFRARNWNLGPLTRLDQCVSSELSLTQLIPMLDFPRARPPRALRHVGPLRTVLAGAAAGGDRAFITLGTLQGRRAGLLRAMADAATACGLHATLVHGGRLPAAACADFPPTVTVRDFLPHAQALTDSRITLCHGGMNSVLDSLAASVPLVIVPLAFEQAAIGARVEAAGVGRVVPARPHSSLTTRLRDAVSGLLADPALPARLALVAAGLHAAGGADLAATLIGQVLEGKPPALVGLPRKAEAARQRRISHP